MVDVNLIYRSIERFAHNQGKRTGQIVMALIFGYLWAPMFVLVAMSFATNIFGFPPQDLTLKWYIELLNNKEAISSILTSLKIGLPVTFVSVLLGVLIAFALDRYKFSGMEYVQLITTLPLIVPLVVTGVALTLFFGLINMQTGYWTVFIAHIIRTIPFAALVIIPTVFSYNQTLEEASMDLGANELRTFRKITLPNILPGIIASGLLVFTISFNEFVYTFFVKGPEITTLPTYIWSRVRFGITPEVNVISTVFILVAGGLVLVAAYLTRVEDITGV
jgi:spermidine/putrescine transport system permease protein